MQLPSERRWEVCAKIVESAGVLVASHAMVDSLLADPITQSHPKYFTPSFDCEQSFSKFILSTELSKPNWNAVCSSDSQMQDCSDEIASDK